jgi:hypothetical protein
MNGLAENHLAEIKAEAARLIDKKYRAGQEEHGGFLPWKGTRFLLDSAIEEALDQVVYLLTLRQIFSLKPYNPVFNKPMFTGSELKGEVNASSGGSSTGHPFNWSL